MKVVIYTRASVVNRPSRFDSIELQKMLCEEYAYNQGFEVVGYFSDLASSKTVNPGWEELLQYCNDNPVNGVVVYSPDRISPSLQKFIQRKSILLSKKVRIYTLDKSKMNDALSDFIDSMLVLSTQLDKQIRAERRRERKQYQKARLAQE